MDSSDFDSQYGSPCALGMVSNPRTVKHYAPNICDFWHGFPLHPRCAGEPRLSTSIPNLPFLTGSCPGPDHLGAPSLQCGPFLDYGVPAFHPVLGDSWTSQKGIKCLLGSLCPLLQFQRLSSPHMDSHGKWFPMTVRSTPSCSAHCFGDRHDYGESQQPCSSTSPH